MSQASGRISSALLHFALGHDAKPRVCAVNYLNTVPLVWGMLHGAERELYDLTFCLPSECADRLRNGRADIGIVPSIEVARQNLTITAETAICCRGPVRSILLVSKVPFERVRTIAMDSSSRTSVMLSRIILRKKYGVVPEERPHGPVLDAMLDECDAALIIGDPALHVNTAALRHAWLDLGAEWTAMTGLPMVFAVWAGRRQYDAAPFSSSLLFGMRHLDEIAAREAEAHGVSSQTARDYLTHNIWFELGEEERRGLDLFMRYAAELDSASATEKRETFA